MAKHLTIDEIQTVVSAFEGYHQFEDEDGRKYGSFEVFWNGDPSEDMPEGWYWFACFPGCIPDGEASGPFDTSFHAYRDAIEG